MPQHTLRIAIEDLPALEGEAALFDAGMDPSELPTANDQVIISLILRERRDGGVCRCADGEPGSRALPSGF